MSRFDGMYEWEIEELEHELVLYENNIAVKRTYHQGLAAAYAAAEKEHGELQWEGFSHTRQRTAFVPGVEDSYIAVQPA